MLLKKIRISENVRTVASGCVKNNRLFFVFLLFQLVIKGIQGGIYFLIFQKQILSLLIFYPIFTHALGITTTDFFKK